MNQRLAISSSAQGILFILSLMAIMDLSILLNIPVLRPISGFLFLTFIPGLLLISILKLNQLDIKNKAVLSIGLSLAFIMFFGLLINTVYPFLDYHSPLAMESVVISFNIIVIVLISIANFRNRSQLLFDFSELKLNIEEQAYLLVPALFPLLAVLGIQFMAVSNNNSIIMALFILIPLYVIFLSVKNTKVSERTYSLVIFSIGISIVLMNSIYTGHIYGTDSHSEFYLFQLTSSAGHWRPFLNDPLDSCLNISILPTVYQSFMNMDPEYLFKFIYVLPLSITPLIVFILYRRYLNNIYAFLASVFFIFQSAFFFQTNNYRTFMAIFFFGLAVLVVFSDKLSPFSRKLFFVIFSGSIIISHYTTSYIILFLIPSVIMGTWLFNKIVAGKEKKAVLPRNDFDQNSYSIPQSVKPENSFILPGFMFYSIFLVFWFAEIIGTSFSDGVVFINNAISHTWNSFVSGTRSPDAYQALGFTLKGSPILNYFNFVINWMGVIFIGIGVIVGLVKRKSSSYMEMESGLIVLSVVASILLAFSMFLPYVLIGYSVDRLYYQCTIILSMFFAIGGIMFSRLFRIRASLAWIVLLIIIVPSSLSTTKVLSQLSGMPASPFLNAPEIIDDPFYVYETEAASAEWVKQKIDLRGYKVYTDSSGSFRLISCGGIPPNTIDTEQIYANFDTKPNGYFYFGYNNVVNNQYREYSGSEVKWLQHDISPVMEELQSRDLIYSNSKSKIYR